ncbi:MAG TPA: hypothetical protein VGK54_09495 [Chloroflexota bacterium]
MTEEIKIEWAGNTVGAPAKWKATATGAATVGPNDDPNYAAYGDTPLDAMTILARVLAESLTYERSHAVAYAGEALKGSDRRA